MIVFALDLGVHTGWAVSRDGQVESGVQTFDLKRGESGGMRYLRFRRWLEEIDPNARRLSHEGALLDRNKEPLLFVYELAHHRGGYTTEVHSGLATRVQEHCAQWDYPYQAVHSATLKKWTTGKGNADKAMMVAAVQHRWHPAVTDDNEADAQALLHYALAELVPKHLQG